MKFDVGALAVILVKVTVDDESEGLLDLSENLVNSYIQMRDKYHTNAQKLAAEGEFRKASELLWGAVTQAIKALAAKRGHRIDNHSQFLDFVQTLAKEIEEPELYKSFLFLNDLHKNFYDETIRSADFEIYYKDAFKFMKRLQTLMENP